MSTFVNRYVHNTARDTLTMRQRKEVLMVVRWRADTERERGGGGQGGGQGGGGCVCVCVCRVGGL